YFTALSLKHRMFVKLVQPELRARPRVAVPLADNGEGSSPMRNDRLRDIAVDDLPMARIVVDANGVLAMANQKARLAFSLNPKDIGRPLQDLEISYRPAELRSLIEQAYAERRAATQTSVERRFQGGEAQYFDIVVAPLFDDAHKPLGVGITFLDVTRFSRLTEELR